MLTTITVGVWLVTDIFIQGTITLLDYNKYQSSSQSQCHSVRHVYAHCSLLIDDRVTLNLMVEGMFKCSYPTFQIIKVN